MITQLDTENDDRDITSYVLSLTDTPNASFPMMCQALLLLGDGAKDLDGTGGTFKIKVNIGSQESHELSYTITAGDTRAALWTTQFPVPANTAVTIYVLSPNGADNDVDVTAYLYDCSPISYTPAELTTVATTLDDMILQVWRRFFKKTEIDHTGLTIKTYKNDGSTVVTTQTIAESNTVETQGAAT